METANWTGSLAALTYKIVPTTHKVQSKCLYMASENEVYNKITGMRPVMNLAFFKMSFLHALAEVGSDRIVRFQWNL